VSDAARMRASDAEREQAADALREHYAAGRLSAEEFGERLDAVYGSSTVQDLAQLRHDLPELPPSPATRRAELQRRQAELGGQLLQRAGGSFSPFVICAVIWAASGASGAFWPAWTLIVPIVFLARNIWRLYGPAPELDRVQRELEHRARHRRHRRPSQLP
jgi:hypothetical protein